MYTNCVAKAVGALEHQVLQIAEIFSVMLINNLQACATIFGYVYPQEAFRRSLFSSNGQGSAYSYKMDVSYEKRVINELRQAGIIDAKKTIFQCACKIVKVSLQLTFLVITAPLSLTLALSGLVMRAFVQNQMNPLTALVPEKKVAPWDRVQPLSICTFNGACTEFATMDKINGVSDTHVRAQEIADFLERTGADIYCLQEFFDVDTLYPVVAKLLQEKGYYVVLTSKRQEVFGMTGGLFLASKYPITNVSFHEYTNRVGIDARTKKGVLGVAIALNDKTTICVANTHMQAGYPDPAQKISGRVVQFHEARALLQALMKKSGANDLFLAGDFNIGRYATPALDHAQFKDDYQGVVEGLLPQSDIDPGYKDLTKCNVGDTFETYLEKESHFDTNMAKNNETEEEKGTAFNTAATSYIYVKDILFLELQKALKFPPEVLKQMIDDRLAKKELNNPPAQTAIDAAISAYTKNAYRKAAVCDHVAFMKNAKSVFRETKYDYEPIFAIGPSGALSDHMALKVTLKPHPKAKRKLEF